MPRLLAWGLRVHPWCLHPGAGVSGMASKRPPGTVEGLRNSIASVWDPWGDCRARPFISVDLDASK